MILNSPYISGSLTVTGNITAQGGINISGSIASASYAVSASEASKLQGLGSSSFAPAATFNTVSQSYAASSASLSTRVTTNETNISTLTSASSSFATMSGSLSTRVTNLEATSSTVSQSFASTSGSISGRVTLIEGQYATTGSNTFTGPQFISEASNAIGFASTASLYTNGGLRVSKDSFVSGTAYFNNVVVYGTSSIQYITSSQVNFGTNIITVNTDTPAVRFGGLSVFDSGSTQLTGSILWDSQNNHWIYSNPSGSSYNSAMLMNGPRNTGSLGTEQGTTNNALMKGQGGDHITSSQVIDDGTTVRIPGNLQVTGSLVGIGTATFSNTVTATQINLGGGASQSQLQNAANNDFILSNSGNFRIVNNSNTVALLTITNAGAATFSNSATAASMFVNTTDNSSGAKLQVSGSINFKSNSGYNGWIISQAGGNSSAAFNLSYGAGGASNVITAQYDTGYVGIGVASPSYILDVSGSTGRIKNSGGSADFILDRASTSAGATSQYVTAGTLKWYTGLRGLANNNFYIFNNATSTNALILDESTNGATFSAGVSAASFSTGGNIEVTTTAAGYYIYNSKPAIRYSYFGYSSGYHGVLVGATSGNQSLFFNVDVSGNPSGAFSGLGSEYVFRNAGSFITPNSINNGYNTLFSWNSSGQLTIPQAATFSSTVGIGGANVSSYLTGVLAVNSSGDNYVSIVSPSANAAGLMFQDVTGTSIVGGMRYTHSDDTLSLWTGGSSRLSISSTGAATFSSTISATTGFFNLNASSTLSLTSAGTNASMVKAGSGDELYIGGNDTWQMRFSSGNILMDNGGNVGIGTSSPEVSFVVKGASIGSGGKASFYGGGDENNWSAANNEVIRIGRADILNAYYSSIWSASGSSGNETLHWLKFYISNGSNTQTLACTMFGSGNVAIAGALSKGSGSFRIKHPLSSKKNTHELVHSFIEGPQADLIYRGKIRLNAGKAIINIDKAATMTEGTFEVLCRDIQCFTSNETSWDAVKGKVEGNILTIECQNTNSTDEISWMVIGERQDEHMIDTDWTDENGKVIVEPLIPEEGNK